MCIHQTHLRPRPKRAVGKRKRWKNGEKKPQAIASNPSQHGLKNGSAMADSTVLQSDGFLLARQTVFRMCSFTQDRWRCDPHTCTAGNTMPLEWTIHRSYTNLAAVSTYPSPTLPYWYKRWSFKLGLHDFPSCRIDTHNLTLWYYSSCSLVPHIKHFNTLRTGNADLRFYITTVQDGWRKSAFLTRACFPCTIHLIMQYM